jgi:hypothetical protein
MNIEEVIDKLVEARKVGMFNSEISAIGEMITDAESHGLIWYRYFKDEVERMQHSILRNPKQFMKEFLVRAETDEGWQVKDIKDVKRIFGLK